MISTPNLIANATTPRGLPDDIGKDARLLKEWAPMIIRISTLVPRLEIVLEANSQVERAVRNLNMDCEQTYVFFIQPKEGLSTPHCSEPTAPRSFQQ